MDGKVCLVTGPTSGIGKEVALELALLGAKLVLVGRSPEKCEQVRQEILAAGGQFPEVIICDMSSIKQVAQAAEKFLALDLSLHVLVNNAGLLNQHRIETEEGLEQAMAVNYFAAFQLTLS
ncbi:MAG: SDR family NAD(P)-dependent oxidoreductase, partial [Deltaproteobacteria bacterium]|nr:SDR family NAD(P)-dependent oxidoreductase [Deltaproteobacteria bacterium]